MRDRKELEAILERAREVRLLCEAVERETYGRSWSLEELALGLVGDVGDLAKLVQAHEGVRNVVDLRSRLEHELADVLWAIIVISDKCGVDLAHAFVTTMDDLARTLGGRAS
jgi:NTP pyrophosphatase (non-canonical NTP hydrolase)